MKKSCICYVTDINYIFPTLVSARQARQKTESELADVIIVLVADDSRVGNISQVCDEMGIQLMVVAPASIGNLHPMYGRLFLSEILSDEYERIVYLDGDTQIARSLAPLIRATIPAGRFLAVRDPTGMYARLSSGWAERIAAERRAAGLSAVLDDYFNTGVLVFDRSEWKELSNLTLKLVRESATVFKYGDQDPMNKAIGDRCLYIENTWNFPGFLIGSPAEKRAVPALYHFMSNPRPWIHHGAPWGRGWGQPYVELVRRFPQLAAFEPKASRFVRARYLLQQFVKCRTEYAAVGKLDEAPPTLAI